MPDGYRTDRETTPRLRRSPYPGSWLSACQPLMMAVHES